MQQLAASGCQHQKAAFKKKQEAKNKE